MQLQYKKSALRCVCSSLKSLNYALNRKHIYLYRVFAYTSSLCFCAETSEILTLMKAEPHLSSWYPMPQARDKKRCWYRMQRTYRTRLLNGEIQRYSSGWVKTHKRLFKQALAGLQEEKKRGVCAGKQQRALHPMWCCRDETVSTATGAEEFISECTTSPGHQASNARRRYKKLTQTHFRGVPIKQPEQ